ncbi:MAG: apolipoprotein N-acyltransferase, partial [Armatimonadota bacterium]
MPEPGWWVLACIALVPFLIAVWDEKPKSALLYGILTGFVYNTIIIWWITIFGYLPWILLVLYQSLFFGVFAVIANLFRPQKAGLLLIIALPSAWVIMQWVRTLGTYAFPWGSFAHTQIPNFGLIQIASITGFYGIDFILFLFNTMFALFLICSKYSRLSLSVIIAIIILNVSLTVYFHFSENKIDNAYNIAKVAMIQRSEETGITATRHEVMNASEVYGKLTIEAGKLNPDFIVWPETALPVAITPTGWGALISSLAKFTNSHLIAGVIEPYQANYDYNYNSAFVYNNNGDMIGKYRKVKLVPFGEFVPPDRRASSVKVEILLAPLR